MSKVDINYEWHDERIPIVNGIIYSDGYVDRINVDYNGNKRVIFRDGKIHLNDLLDNDELGYSSIIINKKLENPDNKLNIYCGEGSYGGDGFVVVESQIDVKVKWIAFFETANPFEKLEIMEDKIFAYNNLNEKWIFNINNPLDLVIE